MNDVRVVDAVPVDLAAIVSMRQEYRREMHCQIVHDSWHARGFTDSYLLNVDGKVVGYGSVAGDPGGPRDAIREFYIIPAYRATALPILQQLIAASNARRISAATNDFLLSLLLYQSAVELHSETILFSDGGPTEIPSGGTMFRRLTDADRTAIFPH